MDELDEVLDLGESSDLVLFHLLHRFLQSEVGTEDDAVGLFEGLHRGLGEVEALEAYGIESEQSRPTSRGKHVRWNIQSDAGHAADEGMGANSTELVNRREASDDRVILNHDMASQRRRIGEDDLVSNLTIMGHMGIGHEEVSMANHGLSATRCCSSIQGHKFPDDVVIAHQKKRLFSLVGKGLRRFPNGGKLEDLTLLAHLGSFPDDDMGANPGSWADRDSLLDEGIGANFNLVADVGLGIDDGSGMDHFSSSPNMASRSASATN